MNQKLPFVRWIVTALLLIAGNSASAQTITVTNPSFGPFCPGATGVANFSTANLGAATASITLTAILSNPNGLGYPATPVVLGTTAMVIPNGAGGGSINLTIPYGLPASSTYNLMITSSFANSVPSVLFQIYPTPVISNATTSVCSGQAANITLASAVTSTFSWPTPTPSGANITGGMAGSGGLLNDVLSNSGTAAGNYIYSITATSTAADGSCVGQPTNLQVNVNPVPVISSITNQNQIVCSAGAVSVIGFNTSATGGTTTYAWTATNAAGTGIAAAGSGNVAAFTAAANATTSPQLSNGTVTPSFVNTSGGPSCPGTAGAFTLTVNPAATVSVSNQNQIVCSGGAVASIGFSTTATGGTTTYAWTATNAAGTGIAAAGNGNVAAFTAAANAGTSPQVSNGSVTPSFTNTSGGPTCAGTANNFSLNVNPVPVVSSVSNQNQIVCSAGAVSAIGFNTTATGGTTTYAWTATNSAGTGIAANGSGNVAGFAAAANAGTSPQLSNGTVTPSFVNTSGGPTCTGTANNFSLRVNPVPVISSITNQNQIVCSAGAVSGINFSTSATGGTTTYTWTATNAAGTGIGASGSGNVAGFTAAANAGTSPQLSNGTVTPSFVNTSGGPSCPGTAGAFTLTVNPAATVSVSNQNQIVCSGAAVSSIGFSTTATGGTTTYAWTATNAAGTGIGAAGNGNVAAFTAAANAGTSPQVSNGSVTPSFTNTSGGPTCAGTANNFSLNVNPVPVVSSVSNQNQIVCSGGAVSVIGFNTTATGGTTTYAWTATNNAGTGIGASGSGNVAGFTAAANAGTSPQLSNGTVTPSFVNTGGGPTCTGTAGVFTLTVNPVAVISAVTNQNQTVCGGSAVSVIGFNTTATGGTTTYAWTATNSAGTGIAANGSGNVSGFTAAANNGAVPQVSNGTVTPSFTNTSGGPTCVGTAGAFSLTVNPIPQYNGPTNLSICSGTSTNIVLSANTTASGNTFAWTLGANTGVIGPVTGTGGTIAQTLANLGTSVASIVYNVTPTFTNNLVSCSGSAAPVTNNVNPIPTYNGPLSTTICSGIATNIVLGANTTPAANNSFAWSLGTNTGGITGAIASNGTSITQTLTNPSPTIPGSIVYNVTPTFTAGGTSCTGSVAAVTANVNPKPFYTGLTNISICSGTNTNLTLQASTPSTFAWTLGTITGGITGALATNGPTISQTLTNPVNTVVGSVIYNVTPTATAGGGCAGTATPVTVNVNPVPAYNGPTNPAAICSGISPNVVLSATSLPSANNSFAWTIGSNPGGVTGASASGGGTIAQVLANPSTTTAATITYNVTPTFTAGGQACSAASATAVNVTVNPLGTVLPISGSQSICSGTNPNIILSSSAGAATFSWTVSNVSPLISGASNTSGAIINQNLTNSSNSSSGTVQYNVTAVTGAGCAGGTASYIIQVNPIPHLTSPTPTSRTICSGDNTAITLVATTGGANSFAWTLLGGANISGKSASGGGAINQTLTNTSNQPDSVFYLVTTISPVSCSNAIPDTIKVVVNPKPVLVSIVPQTICSEATYIASLGASTPSTFTWTVSAPAKITNAAPGSGNTISQTLNNTDVSLPPTVPTSGTATYSITPTSLLGCVGNVGTAIVTVNPLPVVVFTTGKSKTICSGAQTSIPLSANISSSSFTFAPATITSLGLISGQSSSNGTTINQTLNNSSNSVADSIAYNVTAAAPATGCIGKPSPVVVRVNPLPALTSAITDSVCSGATTTTSLTATIPSTYAWSIGTVTGGITGETANPTSSAVTTISQPLLNPSFTSAGFVEYIVTPTSASLPNCTGVAKTITVKVNPSPKLTSDSTRAICSNDLLLYTPTSSVLAGVSIYKYDRTSGVPTIANQFQKTTTNISDTLFTDYILTPAVVDYNFTLTSAAGCSLGNQHLKVTVNPRPDTPGISIFPRTKLCSGATSMNFSTSRVPDPREYFRWSTSNAGTPIQKVDSSFSQNSLISFPNAGNATVTVESISRGFGCISKQSNKQMPVSSAGGNQSVNVVLFANNLVAQVNGAKAYQWGFDRQSDLDSTLLNGETTQSYDTRRGFNAATNYYWVMVTFPDDCVQKAYFNGVSLGIEPQAVQAAEVRVYPNPVQEFVTLELLQAKTTDLVYEIYDLTGKRLLQVASNAAKTRISVSDFAPGYYTVTCAQNGARIATSRFIKN